MKNVYRFFYITPDGTRRYHLDSFCTVSLDKIRAKHYVSDNPDGQKVIIQDNFTTLSNMPCYHKKEIWKGVDFKQVTINYEIVPEEELRPVDLGRLEDRTWGVTRSSDGGCLA